MVQSYRAAPSNMTWHPLVAQILINRVVRKIPRPPRRTGCRCWLRPILAKVLPHDGGVMHAIFLARIQ
ncbi:hypothetical protein T4D_13754 [Trichinella pseudospiralis]|uniref:Uncharacterized protein n=1 Tax=Trichinella pseudospiralis TaxID=6337 RepID=A0A0V1FY79_TRIPS|nr:hypothetical protein T4D_13754 [Trichinella pseudospiralis]